MANIIASAPVLLVKDVERAAGYYRDRLGFNQQEFFGEPTNFAFIGRGGFTLMLVLSGDGQVIMPQWQTVEKMWNVYFWVDDAQAMYDEFRKRGAIIDYGRYTTAWGTKEFGVQDTDDNSLCIGQLLRPEPLLSKH